MIVLLLDYYCDPLLRIAGGDADFGNFIAVDSCSCDLSNRLFKTSRIDCTKRRGCLDILDLIGALWNTPWSLN